MPHLEGEMRRIAGWLDIEVAAERWPELVKAATFAEMKSKAERLAPDPTGIMRSRDAFLRSGPAGSASGLLSNEESSAYEARIAGMVPPELFEWLHRR
jgi:hypothetical protein